MGKRLKTEDVPRCNARLKNGRLCQRIAGTGTRHPYRGKCYEHDGKLRRKPTLYLSTKALTERAMVFANDEDIMNLNREIGAARALLEQCKLESNRDIIYQNLLLQTIGALVERKHRIEVERKNLVKVSFVFDLVNAFIKATAEVVPDPGHREMIARRVDALIRSSASQLFYPETSSRVPAVSTVEEVGNGQ